MYRLIVLLCCCLMFTLSAPAQKKKHRVKPPEKQTGQDDPPESMITAAPESLHAPLDEHHPDPWQRTAIPDGRLSLLLPGKLLPDTNQEETAFTPTARYSAYDQNASFEIDYIKYPAILKTPKSIRTELNRQRKNLLAGQKVVKFEEQDISVRGCAGRLMSWKVIVLGNYGTSYRVEMFVDQDKLYILQIRRTVAFNTKQAEMDLALQAEMAQKFFASVELSGKQN